MSSRERRKKREARPKIPTAPPVRIRQYSLSTMSDEVQGPGRFSPLSHTAALQVGVPPEDLFFRPLEAFKTVDQAPDVQRAKWRHWNDRRLGTLWSACPGASVRTPQLTSGGHI